MPKIDISDTFRKIVITYSGPADATDARVVLFSSLLTEFRAATNVAWLKVKSTNDPAVWEYEFRHTDGRRWVQLLRVSPLPAKTTFDTFGDEWAISEFVAQRALRDVIIDMLTHGVTKIDVDWLAP